MTAIDHPDHYQHPSGIECVDISRHLPHALASAFEYVWRWRDKNGVEDLRKALWWLSDWLAHSTPFTLPGRCYSLLQALEGDPRYPALYAILSGDVCRAMDCVRALLTAELEGETR